MGQRKGLTVPNKEKDNGEDRVKNMKNEIFKNVKENLINATDKLHTKNPIVRSLMQLLPITSAIDAFLATKIENIKRDRLWTFFEELDKGELELTEELIETEDFLHAFFATVNAAFNTRRREKIKMFARLLKSYGESELVCDEYEDYLRILDDLSIREIRLLCLLADYEQNENHGPELIKSIDTHRFWQDFLEKAHQQLDIEKDEIECILASLSRTGCFRVFGLTYSDQLEFSGRLTRTFYKLKELVKEFDVN